MATEEHTVSFRDVPGFPGYRVGDDGSVWSRHKPGPGRVMRNEWRQLAPRLGADGRLRLYLYGDGTHCKNVHRLILVAFHGEREGMLACHNDGNPLNNRLSNLRWDTAAGNQRDRVAHGTDERGERSRLAKLTDERVRAIRSEYAMGGITMESIAARYGVSETAVRHAIRRKTWGHVV